MNKLITFSRILKEYFINGKNKDIILLILKETKSLALSEKQYNQINPTYFDIITSLVHLNADFFKSIDLKDENQIKKVIDIIGISESTQHNTNTIANVQSVGQMPANTFIPPTKTKDCGCN